MPGGTLGYSFIIEICGQRAIELIPQLTTFSIACISAVAVALVSAALLQTGLQKSGQSLVDETSALGILR